MQKKSSTGKVTDTHTTSMFTKHRTQKMTEFFDQMQAFDWV